MGTLFEGSAINGMKLRNRFVRSATWEGMASPEGAVTKRLIETMTALAQGGVGLIISSHAYIRREGQAGMNQLGLYGDELLPGLKEMAAAVHAAGGKMVIQLAHAGHFAAEKFTGLTPWVVSDYEGLATTPRHQLTGREIESLVAAFAAAAGRAKAAGFDGVQIHTAHGYLLSQFLSPIYNRRDDEYGGTIENRSRIHREILAAVRREVGPGFPVLCKINCRDFAEQGLTLEDSLAAAENMAAAGLDALELSGGLPTSGRLSPIRQGIRREAQEGYFQEEARAFKKRLSIPVILVGGIRSFEVAERLVAEGTADYLALSRPLICEPGLIARWEKGDRRKAACLSDSLCFGSARGDRGIYCVTGEEGRRAGDDR
ncbi:MAG: NADH:flavin oxidoreductase [Deltaproteobacteria bacterium]|nr:NADH:flavin oxidoreductase [Deltaproteobacteria bacterium]